MLTVHCPFQHLFSVGRHVAAHFAVLAAQAPVVHLIGYCAGHGHCSLIATHVPSLHITSFPWHNGHDTKAPVSLLFETHRSPH